MAFIALWSGMLFYDLAALNILCQAPEQNSVLPIQSFFRGFARISESISSFFILNPTMGLIFRGFYEIVQCGSWNPVDSIKNLSSRGEAAREFSKIVEAFLRLSLLTMLPF